jgi:hypothetical protein
MLWFGLAVSDVLLAVIACHLWRIERDLSDIDYTIAEIPRALKMNRSKSPSR